MLPVTRLLVVCVAVAAAAALPIDKSAPAEEPTTTVAPAPSNPKDKKKQEFGFQIKSRQSQTGSSSGGASVSSTGSTQGSVVSMMNLAANGYNLNISAAGNGGASGSSATSGFGLFNQKAETNTVASSTGTRRAQVLTGTKGKAVTKGKAGTLQKTGANVGLQGLQQITFQHPAGLPDSFVQVSKKAGASSSSGHKGSTKGKGALSIENLGGTELRRVNPAPVPTDPNDSLSSDSQLKQTGKTTGTSSLSATGSSQGSGGAKFNMWSPALNSSRDLAGITGAKANGGSSGNGFFVQGVQANTELVSTEDGLKVRTGLRGAGTTGGNAGIIEKAGANGKATDVKILQLADGSRQVQLINNQKTTAATSSGLTASANGDSKFRTEDKRETSVKVKPINLDADMLKVPAVLKQVPTVMPTLKPTEGPQYTEKYIPTETPTTPEPEPEPTQPVPTEPVPTKPVPTEPVPTGPEPTEPVPTEEPEYKKGK